MTKGSKESRGEIPSLYNLHHAAALRDYRLFYSELTCFFSSMYISSISLSLKLTYAGKNRYHKRNGLNHDVI